MRWYYGLGKTRRLSVDDMIAAPPLAKTRMVSTICSSKSHGHTLHRKRLKFSFELKRFLPELDLFGHGIRPMDDKAEALDPYRYHVAVENHRSPHHWTEKLADAFLGCTLPFYFGAPNAADYFPPESFVAIDIDRPEETAARIRAAIESEEYERRLHDIQQKSLLSQDDEAEEKRIKLHKLVLKDQMEAILRSHRESRGRLEAEATERVMGQMME